MAAQRTALLLTDDRAAFASAISPMAVEESNLFIQRQWRQVSNSTLPSRGVEECVRVSQTDFSSSSSIMISR